MNLVLTKNMTGMIGSVEQSAWPHLPSILSQPITRVLIFKICSCYCKKKSKSTCSHHVTSEWCATQKIDRWCQHLPRRKRITITITMNDNYNDNYYHHHPHHHHHPQLPWRRRNAARPGVGWRPPQLCRVWALQTFFEIQEETIAEILSKPFLKSRMEPLHKYSPNLL